MLTVNTNIPSLTAQNSLNSATNKMNTAMERMSTGLRINSSKDDAAGLAVSNKMDYQASSYKVAQQNCQMGTSMLDATESTMDTVYDNLTRIRELTEQAANGTYGTDALAAIKTEINTRIDEINRVARETEFNGKKLLDGTTTSVNLQVGISNGSNAIITLDSTVFQNCQTSGSGSLNLAKADATWTDTNYHSYLATVDAAIKKVTDAQTNIGGKQSAITSAQETANVMYTNLTSASSVIKDADIAEESSNYIKYQILQSTSASLLATANQAPSIATQLI